MFIREIRGKDLLRPDLNLAGFDWYLREIISTNELAGTGLKTPKAFANLSPGLERKREPWD